MKAQPICCPQCSSPQYTPVRQNVRRCAHCGTEYRTADAGSSADTPSAQPETPRSRLKEILVTLAILLAAALLLELMQAA